MKFFDVQDRLHCVRSSLRRSKISIRGKTRERVVAVLVTVAVVASMVTMAAWPSPTSASYTNVLYNGSFEQGFNSQAGCGMVGAGWQCFTNGGAANYGFYDDQWDRTVFDGKHSQLIEINTKGIMLGDADRYAGIYQTVPVVNWAEYTLNLEAMIRTTVHDGDPWRYRVQVGWSFGPYADWTRVTNWQDIGLDNYWERTDPHGFAYYSKALTAQADTMTVYVRAWKKWGVPNEEIDINLDAIALNGPSPLYWQQPVAPVQPVQPGCMDPCGTPVQPVQPIVQPVQPIYPPVQPGCTSPCRPLPPVPNDLCMGPNLVQNGDFEAGFYPVSVGHVGTGWGYFITAGGANYGFYDDQWPRVRADGHSSQLIEINTKNIYPLENDRYAGIFQYLTGLVPGATYEFSMKGLLRGAGNEDDPYRFAAEVGYSAGYQANWSAVSNWTEMNLGPIYKRTEPGALGEYKLKFTAPSSDVTLFIRGWKKWGIPQVEMDFNIDAVSVRACLLTGGPVVEPWYGGKGGYDGGHGHDGWDGHGQDGYSGAGYAGAGYAAADYGSYNAGAGMCSYTVTAGDTLAWVAQSMGATTYDIISANGIANPDLIFVGQVLSNPSCSAGGAAYGAGYAPGATYGATYDTGTGAAYETGAGYEAGATDGAAYETGAGYATGAAYTAPDYSGAMSEYQVAASYGAGNDAAYATAGYAAGDMALDATGAGYASDPYAGAVAEYPMASAAPQDFQGYTAAQGADAPSDGLPYADAAAQGAPGYDAVAMAPMGNSYAVQPGDTLSQIAAANGLAVRSLMDANGIANPNIIFVGQVLILP